MITSLIDSAQRDERGFSLLELALVLVFVGLIAGGGLLLFGKTVKTTTRKNTADHLELQKQSLLIWARLNGALPCSTKTSGLIGFEFDPTNTSRKFPYVRLGMTPNDAWGNEVRYQSADAAALCKTTPANVCRNLRNWNVAWSPQVYREGAANTGYAAVLVSGGEADLDGDGSGFDQLPAAGAAYAISRPTPEYDDLVTAITSGELYDAVRSGGGCAYAVTVSNLASGATVFVYNRTKLRDVGVVGLGTSAQIWAEIDDVLEIRTVTGGGGSILTTTPVNPYTVTGTVTITL